MLHLQLGSRYKQIFGHSRLDQIFLFYPSILTLSKLLHLIMIMWKMQHDFLHGPQNSPPSAFICARQSFTVRKLVHLFCDTRTAQRTLQPAGAAVFPLQQSVNECRFRFALVWLTLRPFGFRCAFSPTPRHSAGNLGKLPNLPKNVLEVNRAALKHNCFCIVYYQINLLQEICRKFVAERKTVVILTVKKMGGPAKLQLIASRVTFKQPPFDYAIKCSEFVVRVVFNKQSKIYNRH